MEIKRAGSQASTKGSSDDFTGTVRIDPLFDAPEPARVSGAASPLSRCPYGVAHASTRTNADRDGGLGPCSAGAGRSRKSGQAMSSGSRPAKSTGMGHRRLRQ